MKHYKKYADGCKFSELILRYRVICGIVILVGLILAVMIDALILFIDTKFQLIGITEIMSSFPEKNPINYIESV